MKDPKKTYLLTALCSTLATLSFATDLEGLTPGERTMDLQAAQTYAAEQKQPILLDFSGSDWCGWCKLMDENVFEKPEWKTYASSNLVMVLIDFPNDKSLVPEKYVARNAALQEKYGIEGFPTFILLDDDGKTVLGQLQAGREKTPSSFIAELEALLKNRPAAQQAFMNSLSPANKATFTKLTTALNQKKEELSTVKAEIQAATEKSENLTVEVQTLTDSLKEFKVGLRGEEKLAEFNALKAALNTKQQALIEWINAGPEQNEENMALFEAKRAELTELNAKIEAF